MDRITCHRLFYARLVTSSAGVKSGPVVEAFEAVPRENFVGKGPWRIFTSAGYIETPTDDPALLYADMLVALTESGPINNGQPSLHAACISALNVQKGESIVHVGAGTGYYTAILAHLTGAEGSVAAFEIEGELAVRATENLAGYPNVTVHARSGSEAPLPHCDALYVNAGATAPLDVWLDALHHGGRLLFPLTPDAGFGGMLLVTRREGADTFGARFLTRAMFIPCAGARDEETAAALTEAFKSKLLESVRSLQRHSPPDDTCWFAGKNWWLSTALPD